MKVNRRITPGLAVTGRSGQMTRPLIGRTGLVMACAARGAGLATGWSTRRR